MWLRRFIVFTSLVVLISAASTVVLLATRATPRTAEAEALLELAAEESAETEKPEFPLTPPLSSPSQRLRAGGHQGEREQEVTLIAVGDIMLSRNVAAKIKAKKDPYYPFLKTRDLLQSADISFGNLEGPLTPGREVKTGEMRFRADPALARVLKDVGFDVLSLANNHLPDYGAKGIATTLEALEKSGIAYAGAGMNATDARRSAIIEANGIRLSFLAYNDTDVVPPSYGAGEKRAGTAFMDIKTLKQDVAEAKRSSDLVIVSMHSGAEYTHKPNKRQIAFAHAAIDAGAALVIGHHPHVIQPTEKYKDGFIIYSLGNFVFDQMWSRETREGLMMKITLTKDGVRALEPMPILIEDYSQPRLMTEAERARIEKLLP